jgi:hypothetical protein
MVGSSWIAAQLAASQEGLIPMKLAKWTTDEDVCMSHLHRSVVHPWNATYTPESSDDNADVYEQEVTKGRLQL